MFNPDANAKSKDKQSANKKLPKIVIMMIEKNNMVMAIKTLAADENISMDAAKERIDAYEICLKIKQQQKLVTIANKQGIPSAALSADSAQTPDNTEVLIKNHVKKLPTENDFTGIKQGLDNTLNDLGYKKPLVPYWAKRLFIMAMIMLGLLAILWQILV